MTSPPLRVGGVSAARYFGGKMFGFMGLIAGVIVQREGDGERERRERIPVTSERFFI